MLTSFPDSCEWAQESGNEVNGVRIHSLAWPRPIRTGSDISNRPECRSGNGAIPNVDSTSVVITTAYHQSVLYFFLCHVTYVVSLPPRSAGGGFSEDASAGTAGAGSYHGGTVREQSS